MGENKAGHTPGPWAVGPGVKGIAIVAREWEIPHVATAVEKGRSIGETEANARLIAAAPDLLESARRIVNGVHSEYRIPADADDGYIHDTIGTALSDAYFSARAAIAKAEGRS